MKISILLSLPAFFLMFSGRPQPGEVNDSTMNYKALSVKTQEKTEENNNTSTKRHPADSVQTGKSFFSITVYPVGN